MANHCSNYAQFVGEPSELKKLVGRLNKARKAYLELPEDTRGNLFEDEVWFYAGNYNIVIMKKPHALDSPRFDVYEEYGSKWFDCFWQIQYKNNSNSEIESVTLQGSSAWSPVTPLFQKICKKFKLKASGDYEESGMDFAGKFEIDRLGNIIDNQMSYREYQINYNFDAYFEQIMFEIEDGYFESLENVYQQFEGSKLTKDQKKLLKETFESHSQNNLEINTDLL